MAIDDSILFRAAGLSAIVAIFGLLVSGITIALFFGGAGDAWGPVNDLAVAATLLALVLPILAIDRMAGREVGTWFRIVTVAALAGIILAAVGQVLLVIGRINLEASFVTGGIGIMPVFIWLLAIAYLSLGASALPSPVGWLAIGIVVLSAALTVIAGVTTGPATWVASAVLLVAIAGWMASIAASLLESGSTVA